MSRHTPGPWKVYNDGTDVCDDSGHIAACEGTGYDETVANARLIAAAPSMYEALKEMLSEANCICPLFAKAAAILSQIDGE